MQDKGTFPLVFLFDYLLTRDKHGVIVYINNIYTITPKKVGKEYNPKRMYEDLGL